MEKLHYFTILKQDLQKFEKQKDTKITTKFWAEWEKPNTAVRLFSSKKLLFKISQISQ